jgi:L-amino acid N-acyltransferase YncA
MESEAGIRRAELRDLESITKIYNDAILNTTATFDAEPKSIDGQRKWFTTHDERYPILVAEINGQVVGWAALTRWSDRTAYDGTAETSFYVDDKFRGRGIGWNLKQAVIEEARRLGFHTLIARVAEGSETSLRLNQRAGFVLIGTMKEVGRKFGGWLDVHVLQKMLD